MATQTNAAKAAKTAKKKVVKVEATGRAYVTATFNNIIISLMIDRILLSWSSFHSDTLVLKSIPASRRIRCAEV